MKQQIEAPVFLQELVKNGIGTVGVITNPLSALNNDFINKILFGGR